jgi:hypothetical protein
MRAGRGPSLSTNTAPDGPQGLSKVSCLSFVLVASRAPGRRRALVGRALAIAETRATPSYLADLFPTVGIEP